MTIYHQGPYRCWCKSSDFYLMLPKDAKTRHKEALDKVMEQSQVNDHFHPMNPDDRPTPYSDEVFKEAALQWLIKTDQITTFEHPSFLNMINIVS
ncbi:hypothetical protein F5148DRAFT_989071 [Russula earlei]|uniref:Uncharacterized protein n=1 Tax=Russula earlei TaxID=71964 RepID=A0ACC0TUN4_9AGAM|nr:hypothetical protein F5148DRAFT_989071 [Russula earlei]